MQQNFERVLALDRFKGLRAILDKLSTDREAQCKSVSDTTSFEDLVGRLGYRVSLTKQIHVQDAFSRMGRAGGVRAVLPYYDIPTQSSLPTVVHYDSTVTTTPKSVAFFNEMLTALKLQMNAKP